VTLIRPLDTILAILILIASGLAIYFFQGVSGNKAEVYLGSTKVATFDLNSDDRIKEIETRIGTVRLRVGNGSIQVLSSPCDQKICILQGAITHTDEHIICLPARMFISVSDRNQSETLFDQIDAISY
jgi:hypothetical protein